MDSLANIARSATPSTGVQFRRAAYGEAGIRDFLRDVIAMANAPVDGSRYIVVGVAVDKQGIRRIDDVAETEFSGKLNYEAVVSDAIEPPIRIRYERIEVDGHEIGVFEIGDCQDRPYMMRVDHSETLRRGDAYVRGNDKAVKMGRRQLQSLFEQKFRESVSAESVEIGFPGDIIHKDRQLPVCKLDGLPSAVAVAKLEEMLRIKSEVDSRGSTTMLARLTHARLFGPDDPYEDRSREQLLEEMRAVKKRHLSQDANYLFEQRAEPLQLVVFNQGEEDIRDASVSIVMPNEDGFHVASELPPLLRDGRYIERTAGEQSAYPAVSFIGGGVQITSNLGDIQPGEQMDVFESPLRICAESSLGGRRFALQYALFAQNLRVPAKGRLRLLFNTP